MFRRLNQSWALSKTCLRVLAQDKELMLFPVLSGFLTVLVIASFFVPGFFAITHMSEQQQSMLGYFSIPICFLFYFCTYAVVLFCNTALLSCAKIRFEGGDPTFGDGIRSGMANLGPILSWAAIGGIIGVILKQLEENLGFLGSIMRRFLGGAWAVITYFALPVMIFEKKGPREAVSRSKEIIQATWGEALGAYVGFGALNFFIGMCIVASIILSIVLSIAMSTPTPMIVAFVAAFVVVLLASIITSCLSQIFQAALYVYATTKELPSCFEPELVTNAFVPKNGKKWLLVRS